MVPEIRRRIAGTLWLLLLLCAVAARAPAQQEQALEQVGDAERERLGHDLDSLRERIRSTHGDLQEVQDQQTVLLEELAVLEAQVRTESGALERLRGDMRGQRERLRELRREQAELSRRLAAERVGLARQLRWMQQLGHGHLLQLLLGLEKPRRMGRALACYQYLNQQRGRAIQGLREDLRHATEVGHRIQLGTRRQLAGQAEHESKLNSLRELRARRDKSRVALEDALFEHHRELAVLLREEHALLRLLEGVGAPLGEEDATRKRKFHLPSFEGLRGRLRWPATGSLLRVFGARDARSGLRSSGVLIGTESNTPVQAVSAGEVVFADQFQNLGLLLVLDHGGGYMSLYAHNRSLLGEVGRKVTTGEVIAYSGGKRGLAGIGLYFEIRHQGVALDPARWCRR